MKQGPKPAEPRMEDVLASIRRAIDENAIGAPPDRFGGAMAELRAKLDRPPPAQDSRSRRDDGYNSIASPQLPQQQGFAGILGTSRSREAARRAPEPEPIEHEPEPVTIPPEEDGQPVYNNGYYGAPAADYDEPAPVEAYQPAPPQVSQRYLPPPARIEHRQSYVPEPALMSESSSAAAQASFNQLAETVTRRALNELPIAEITHELLRGMLKEWLDNNLPKIVEKLVREEIERVVRRPQR